MVFRHCLFLDCGSIVEVLLRRLYCWCCKGHILRLCRIVEEKVFLGDFPTGRVDGDHRIANLVGPGFHHFGNINVPINFIHSLKIGHKLVWWFMKSKSWHELPSCNLNTLPSASIPRGPSVLHFYISDLTGISEEDPKRREELQEEFWISTKSAQRQRKSFSDKTFNSKKVLMSPIESHS